MQTRVSNLNLEESIDNNANKKAKKIENGLFLKDIKKKILTIYLLLILLIILLSFLFLFYVKNTVD